MKAVVNFTDPFSKKYCLLFLHVLNSIEICLKPTTFPGLLFSGNKTVVWAFSHATHSLVHQQQKIWESRYGGIPGSYLGRS